MLKRCFLVVLSISLVILLASCGAPEGIDVSSDLEFTVDGDSAMLDSYLGNEKNIIIPDTLGGKNITRILPSFAEDKDIQSVVLPSQISNYALNDSGYMLCANGESEHQIPINQFTAKGVYCRFFNSNSIWVNGEQYKYNAKKALEFSNLKGIWKTTCEVNGVNSVVYIEFTSEGTFIISRENKTAKTMVDYEIKEDKLSFEIVKGFSVSMNPDDIESEQFEMERIGDALVIWSENVIFYPAEDLEKAKPESDAVWVYEEVERGIMITGYKGNAAIPSFPTELDGKEVCCIKSTVADDYDFANISINTFDFFGIGDDGYCYLNNYGGDVLHLTNDLSRQTAYCKFFNKDSMIVNDRIYSAAVENYTVEDFEKVVWSALGNEQHPASVGMKFIDNGTVVFIDNEDESEITGNFTYTNGVITVTISGKTVVFDFMGDTLICWEGSDFFESTLGADQMVIFETPYTYSFYSRYGDNKWGYCEEERETGQPHGNTLTFDGFTVVFEAEADSPIPSGTYDYTIRGNKLVLSGSETHIFKMEYNALVDEAGNYYYTLPLEE